LLSVAQKLLNFQFLWKIPLSTTPNSQSAMALARLDGLNCRVVTERHCQIHDGIPDPNDNSIGAYRRYMPRGPLNSAPICGEPKYDVLRACARKYFYEEVGKPKSLYSGLAPCFPMLNCLAFADAVLYMINGCLRCPFGDAVATVRLVNKLPSGALFSTCKAEDRIIRCAIKRRFTNSFAFAVKSR